MNGAIVGSTDNVVISVLFQSVVVLWRFTKLCCELCVEMMLPELDFVDVAGQEKKKQKKVQPNKKSVPQRIKDMDKAMERDEKVLAKLESLKDRMKVEVAMGDLEAAKRIEDELESIMKKEGYDFSWTK